MIGGAGVASIARTRIGDNLLSCIVKCAFVSLKILIMFLTVGCVRRFLGKNYAGEEGCAGGEGAYGRENIVSCYQGRKPWLNNCLLGCIRASSVIFVMAG